MDNENQDYDIPFDYSDDPFNLDELAEQNQQFYGNLKRGVDPVTLNQNYNPPAQKQSFKKSEGALAIQASEKAFEEQMAKNGFVILDVPYFGVNQDRNKRATELGAYHENYHYLVDKETYENTPELQEYGKDKRIYFNMKFEASRQIKDSFMEVFDPKIAKHLLEFDRVNNLNYMAGHTAQDHPEILAGIKQHPDVFSAGDLDQILFERQEYQRAKYEEYKNFNVQSYLKINLPAEPNTPEAQAYVAAFKAEAKGLGANVQWQNKMKMWKLDVKQDSPTYIALANKFGTPDQKVSLNAAAVLAKAQAEQQAVVQKVPTQQQTQTQDQTKKQGFGQKIGNWFKR